MDAEGASGGLGILWKDANLKVEVMSKHQNWIRAKVSIFSTNLNFEIFNVYGPIKIVEKQAVWQEIGRELLNVKTVLGGTLMPFWTFLKRVEG